MVAPAQTVTRYDLSVPFSEFDSEMNQRGYISPQVLVPRTVGIQSADVGKLKLEQLLQQQDTLRARGAGYGRGDFKLDKYSYATDEYGWEEPMDDRTLAIYDDIIDSEETHTQRCINVVCDDYERAGANAIYDTSVWTGADLTTSLDNEWDDKANATPIEDIISAREKIVMGAGLEPNTLVLNRRQWRHLINCDEVVDRVKYTARATAAEIAAAVADVLDIEKLLVAGGLTNDANPEAERSISRIWSNEYAMLCRTARTNDPKEPCIGRTFIWTGDGPGALGTDEKLALITEMYRDEKVRGDVVRVRNDRDIQVMYKEAGHLLSNVLTL